MSNGLDRRRPSAGFAWLYGVAIAVGLGFAVLYLLGSCALGGGCWPLSP
ncbi:MAG TPA: hypothetical protein VNU97_19005 [Rhizomicrobium sp.]|nr:hypothetical protein [Rhizomicrobium sp.]